MKTKFCLLLFILMISNSLLSQTVFMTRTGKKYHTQSCRYANSSASSVELQKAKDLGLEPCKVCSPPTEVSNNSQKEDQKVETQESSSKSESTTSSNESSSKPESKKSSMVQCSGTTKSGKRCSRNTSNSSGRCFQHGG